MSGITIPTLDEITGHTVMAKLRSLCKRFIGLAEEVDEKIDAPLEEAHLAVETANATLATAQESLEDAQDAVTTANSASETATLASESAQESAETVAGYDTRLAAVELKVQTAEGNIVTIQGQITDLQTADGQNVKLTGEHAIGNYAVLLTGNQSIQATKNFVGELIASGTWNNKAVANVENASTWRRIYYNVTVGTSNQLLALFMTPQKPSQNSNEYGILIVGNNYAKWVIKGDGVIVENFVLVVTAENQLELWVKNYNGNRGLAFTRLAETNWGNIINNWRPDNTTIDADFDPTTYLSYTVSS